MLFLEGVIIHIYLASGRQSQSTRVDWLAPTDGCRQRSAGEYQHNWCEFYSPWPLSQSCSLPGTKPHKACRQIHWRYLQMCLVSTLNCLSKCASLTREAAISVSVITFHWPPDSHRTGTGAEQDLVSYAQRYTSVVLFISDRCSMWSALFMPLYCK